MLPSPRISALSALCCLALSLAAQHKAAAAEIHTAFLKVRGESDGDFFGSDVASADLNGDGRDDLVVGARSNTAVGENAGRVYVYFGGNAAAIPDAVLDPPYAYSYFGGSLAVGDVNGDGSADLIVGASGLGDPHYRGGHAYIYLGGSSFDSAPDLTIAGPSALDGFGYSVSMAADFNSDGFGDFIVGARGAAYVFWGGPTLDTTPDLTLIGPPLGAFGSAVAGAGDFNDDGTADIAVHAYSHVYIYFGGSPPDTSADVILLHQSPAGADDRFGEAFAAIGDVNGDGSTDFITSAFQYGLAQGQAYIYFGGHDPDAVADVTMTGRASFDVFGFSVSPAGDVNGDGFSDLVVGLLGSAPGAGRALVFFGGSPPDTIPDLELNGDPGGWGFTAALSLGDMNGDGAPDLLVGESGTDRPDGVVGQAYAFDIASVLPARAFVNGAPRTFPITGTSPPLCIGLEPVGDSYLTSDVDPSSLRLVSNGTGEVESIAPISDKHIIVSDGNSNGRDELGVCFGQPDLARLFSRIMGRATLQVAIEGRVMGGRRFRAPLDLTIQNIGHRASSIARVYPNPFNPTGTLLFETTTSGPVSAHLYDLTGRRVRTVAASVPMAKGAHRLSIDGRDDRGEPLGSGMYFYRIEESSGSLSGKIVIAR